MKTLPVIAVLFVAPVLALAGGHAAFHVTLPERPTLAEVQPGVQVVLGVDEEVFFAGQQYWVRRDDGWYRAKHHTEAFTHVESDHVPSALVDLEPGQYRHHRPAAGHDEEDGYDDGHDHGSEYQGGHGGCGGHGSHGHGAH